MQPSGKSDIAVSFDLPPGWIELPTPGPRPGGLLRRNPYEALARRLASTGAIINQLVRATAAYLERVAAADPGALGIATYVEARNREEHTFATFAVLPGPAAGGSPLEELASRRADPRESDHTVEPVDLPWGKASRASYTRPRLQGEGEPRPFVQYWAAPEGQDQLLILLGDVDAPTGAPVEAFISDIDRLARTLTISRR